jgi:hypothetical protein
MRTEVLVVLLSVGGAAITAALGAFLAPPVKGWFEKRNQAAALRSRYVPPLLQAAYDLQSRLYKIVRQDFMRAYAPAGGEQHAYAVRSTLWLLAQYLGWVEILRREGQFLDFGSRKKNRQLQGALSKITHELSTDKRSAKCAVFRGEQRAIGELMIRTVHDAKEGEPRQKDCLGYAEFVRRLDEAPDDNGSESADFLSWFSRLRGDLQSLATEESYDEHDRLIRVQRALVDLVDNLDPDRVRYPYVDARGRLPLPEAEEDEPQLDESERLAHFEAQASEYPAQYRSDFPWSLLNDWAETQDLKVVGDGPDRRTYLERPRYRGISPYLGARLTLTVGHTRRDIDVHGAARTPPWAHRLRVAPTFLTVQPRAWRFPRSRRRARRIANALLGRFDRPVLR